MAFASAFAGRELTEQADGTTDRPLAGATRGSEPARQSEWADQEVHLYHHRDTAQRENESVYELLTLVDALRGPRTRTLRLARELLTKRLLPA